jgi:hypothetical protein
MHNQHVGPSPRLSRGARPPRRRRRLEPLTAEHTVASREQPTTADDTRRLPTEGQVGESWRYRVNVPVRPAEPSGQPGWLVLGLGVLAAALAPSGGLAAMLLRRTRGRVRVRQVAACMCIWWHLMGPARPLHVG